MITAVKPQSGGRSPGQFDRFKVRSKGSTRPTWDQANWLVAGNPVELRNFAPTLDRYGGQEYGVRTIQATAPILSGDTEL